MSIVFEQYSYPVLAESKGYSRSYLLSTQDKYKQSPLHSAINSGNVEVKKRNRQLCLLLILYPAISRISKQKQLIQQPNIE